jgi:hypothetical protein
MARVPRLTKDNHLHSLSAEEVYRIHHAMDQHTGEPLPGAQVNHDECGCAHCVSHVEQNPQVLADAQAAHAANPDEPAQKRSKAR